MLTTFVIGLREGLEASLIVGIIAAFLRRNGAPRAVRQMWLGVLAAVAICLVVGVTLALVSAALPQREQEMLECVIALVAVAMVTYMILWMNAHSRGLKSELESAAASALARGSVLALVAMAFLAVLREGFETAVFLVAAFGSANSPVASAIGVVLGIASAVVLGYLIYRGGTRINLSRFFRITGVVLVLVAGGLVMSALRAANEAGWLATGQQQVLDLSWLVQPGSVQASLLSGMLGLQAHPVVVEVTAWLLYVGVMLAVVLWPRTKRLTRPAAARVVLSGAAVAGLAAVLLAVLVPRPASRTGVEQTVGVLGTDAGGASTSGSVQLTVTPAADGALAGSVQATLAGLDGLPQLRSDAPLTLVGSETVAGALTSTYQTAPQSVQSSRTPGALTGADAVQLNGGRRPIGLTTADLDASLPASYLDRWQLTVAYDSGSGLVLDAQLQLSRVLQVVATGGATVSVGSPAAVTVGITGPSQLAQLDRRGAGQQFETWGQVVPAVLGVSAVLAAAFGLLLLRRRPPTAATRPASTPPADSTAHTAPRHTPPPRTAPANPTPAAAPRRAGSVPASSMAPAHSPVSTP